MFVADLTRVRTASYTANPQWIEVAEFAALGSWAEVYEQTSTDWSGENAEFTDWIVALVGSANCVQFRFCLISSTYYSNTCRYIHSVSTKKHTRHFSSNWNTRLWILITLTGTFHKKLTNEGFYNLSSYVISVSALHCKTGNTKILFT